MVLPPMFVGCFTLPACLFWYLYPLFNLLFNYLGISYPAYAALIFAGSALSRAAFAACFPLFVSGIVHG